MQSCEQITEYQEDFQELRDLAYLLCDLCPQRFPTTGIASAVYEGTGIETLFLEIERHVRLR